MLVLLLPVFGVIVFWLLPWPFAAGVYAAVLIVSLLLYRSVKKAAGRLWNRTGRT